MTVFSSFNKLHTKNDCASSIYILDAVLIPASKLDIYGFSKHNFTSCAQLTPRYLTLCFQSKQIANARRTRNINT